MRKNQYSKVKIELGDDFVPTHTITGIAKYGLHCKRFTGISELKEILKEWNYLPYVTVVFDEKYKR